ncbi:DNA cytosine methyltransferase [Neisseria weixii]|uniref:DNA cytosine methyltransferase n=1 Tax=Neisseria weixii TaxID=1853276 RepID=UPI0035A02788
MEGRTVPSVNGHENKPLIFSFFSGAGFLDLGFELSGFDIAFVNEVHPPFLHAYKYSRERMGLSAPKYGYFEGSIDECLNGTQAYSLSDLIRKEKDNHRIIGFIGGPPCPDFSVAGKNRGQNGENGKLSQRYIDLICRNQPDFFVFENVKGLYRTAKHREFFNALKSQLSSAGYSCTEKLINAVHYGAPQDRERIILIGFLRQPETVLEHFDWEAQIAFPDALDKDWPMTDVPSAQPKLPENIYPELTVQHWFDKNDVENHPNASKHFQPRAGLSKFQTIEEGDDKKKSYKRLHRWRYSPTAAYGNNEVHIHPYLPRRISAAEALAIQSLPKEFELPEDMTLSNMFKTIGNGVPFLAAKGIALTVKDFLEKHYEPKKTYGG